MIKTPLTEEMILARLKRAALHDNKSVVLECAAALVGDGTALESVARALSIAETRPNRVLIVTDDLHAAVCSWMVPGARVPTVPTYGWSGGNQVDLA